MHAFLIVIGPERIRSRFVGGRLDHHSVLEAREMMVRDPALLEESAGLIRKELVNAEWACARVVSRLRSLFDHVADRETDSRWIAYLLKHGWSGNRYATAVASALEEPTRAFPAWFRSAVAALEANAAAGQSTWAIVEDGGTLEYEDVQTVLNEHRRNMELKGLATGVSVAHSSTQDASQSASSDCG